MRKKRNCLPILTVLTKISAYLLALGLMISMFAGASVFSQDERTPTTGTDLTFADRNSYRRYASKHKDKPEPDRVIEIDINEYKYGEGMEIELKEDFEDKPGTTLVTRHEGFVEWSFIVPEEGLYKIEMDYYPVRGNNSGIERKLSINGKVPFDDAYSILFQRIWVDGDNILIDRVGNEYRPFQIESPQWVRTIISGSSGFSMDEFKFYFEAGEQTLRLTSVKEPMAIGGLRLLNTEPVPTYEQKLVEYEREGFGYASSKVVIQGQEAIRKSDPTLYPISDTSSPLTSPTDIRRIVLNSIGGFNWRYPRQWIEWEFEVPESGLYKIAIRAKQSYSEGTYSSRSLTIDGELPFRETSVLNFPYRLGWQLNVPGGEEDPYYFYFEEGRTYTMRLENSLGEISNVLTRLENTIYQLNAVYRRILMVTGAFPDPHRDYHVERRLPESMEILEEQMHELLDIKEELFEITGSKGADYARIERLAFQIRGFIQQPDTIPERLDSFRINVSDSAAWISHASEQPLLVDTITLLPKGAKFPPSDVNFIRRIVYEVQLFIQSFFTDYSMVGIDDEDNDSNITLWLGGGIDPTTAQGGGRDQAQVIKSLTDNYFEPFHTVGVNVKLVDPIALLPAVATGAGPDFAIMQDRTLPVNYALRNAVYDFTNFEDYEKVLERFDSSAYESYWIEDRLYAIPETQIFNMMFYRTDILHELGLQVPETWQDFYETIPTLQRNSLQIALPNLEDNNLEVFFALLYQRGGTVYNEDRTRAILNSNESVDAFMEWSELYTKYRLPQRLDATTRFRTGEAPLAIAPFTFYNQLVIAAPEIRGMWDFAPIPGTLKEDGTINRTSLSGGTGSVIFRNSDNKEGAWDFIKWWTSADTQLKYAQEIESLMGPAARWPTANLEAFDRLAWTSAAARSIREQREFIDGLPEVPGGYMLGRYVGTAIRLVINNGYPPRDSIMDFNKRINDEIIVRRMEFGME